MACDRGLKKGDERKKGGGGLKDITLMLKRFWARKLLGKRMDGWNCAAAGGAKIIGKNEVNAIIGWQITGDLLT